MSEAKDARTPVPAAFPELTGLPSRVVVGLEETGVRGFRSSGRGVVVVRRRRRALPWRRWELGYFVPRPTGPGNPETDRRIAAYDPRIEVVVQIEDERFPDVAAVSILRLPPDLIPPEYWRDEVAAGRLVKVEFGYREVRTRFDELDELLEA